jgi:hypothetical protein
MSNFLLPGPDEAYRALRLRGEQFTDEPEALHPLGERTFEHYERGQLPVIIDARVAAANGRMYADESAHAALREHGARTGTLADAADIVERYMSEDELMWGFSGFATAGPAFKTEAQGMSRLFERLEQQNRLPSLVSDGAARAGILGLCGVIARRHGVPTLGFTPWQGLSTMAPRDHMVVAYDTYMEREDLVGMTPDILVCVGGGDGARRECQATIRFGGAALLLALKDYGPKLLTGSFEQFEDLAQAQADGRLVVARSLRGLPKALREVQEAGEHAAVSRATRLSALRETLL